MSDRSTLVVTDQSAVTMTSTTTGSGHLCQRYGELAFFVDVTAASGTSPTLNVTIEHSPDNAIWRTLATVSEITTTGDYGQTSTGPLSEYVRAVYTIAGTTPSFTFTSKLHFKT